MNYNTIKDKSNVNELTSMLIQEEMRLKYQRAHTVYFLKHQEAGKSFKKRSGKSKKKGPCNLNNFLKGAHKEPMVVKCHFCKKSGHMNKDCLKRKAWFEKKGVPYDPNHKAK
ncbi:uncharacterized protein LOC127799025 [Diospyros lotus]|uniref:uncharacterized protein LOC127799025 n=1 Tax=Diospyros lotus TaxID=55363 RepID=UPI002255B86F|nr:uncharacterized protein LOC127799025 [Diospyros lotus]